MTKKPIYAAIAAHFHAWGASIIPLHEHNENATSEENAKAKTPLYNNCASFGRTLISSSNLNTWSQNHPCNNAGLTLGAELIPGKQLVAVDIDDDRLVPFGLATLGKTICAKKGNKGITIFALADKDLKTKRIHLVVDGKKSGKPVIEILANRSQTVVPPSIHPSGNVYEYVHCKPLYEYAPAELPELTPDKITFFEVTTASEHTPVIMGGVGTHDATLRLVAQLVAAKVDKATILAGLPALFPADYKGDSIDQMPGMVDSAIQAGFGKVAVSKTLDMYVAQKIVAELNPILHVDGERFIKYQNGHWPKFPEKKFDFLIMEKLQSAMDDGLLAPMIKHVRHCAELLVHRETFGKFSEMICCQNGTLNVLTGELVEWSPEHELRYQLDFAYDADAKCPLYEEHLFRTMLGDVNAISTFEEFSAYTLIPDNSMQKALYLIGEGGGGKSTLLRVVIAMHDRRAVSVTSLTKVDDERHITDLANKLLCVSADIQPKHNAAAFGEGFTRITGGDSITTRKLFHEVQGNVQTPVRFMGSMNKLPPKFIAAPDALKRRLIFLPCGGKIEQPDPDFMQKLLAERPGILARWVKALQRLMQRGYFEIPASSHQLVEQYLETQDPVQCFVNECLEIDENAETPVKLLFEAYTQWAEGNLEQKFSKNTFGKHLHACGLKQSFKKQAGDDDKRGKTARIYRVRLLPGHTPRIVQF